MHVNDPMDSERRKYQAMWAESAYEQMSPGFEFIELFVEVCQPKMGDTLVDIGCGSGVAGHALAARGLQVRYVDLVDVLDPDLRIAPHSFIKSPIFGNWHASNKYGWDFGYCCDVMEHLPPEWTMLAVERVVRACRTSFFTIALQPDNCGQLINDTLHLTVQPFTWWRDRLAWFGNLVEARDLCGRGLFVLKRSFR